MHDDVGDAEAAVVAAGLEVEKTYVTEGKVEKCWPSFDPPCDVDHLSVEMVARSFVMVAGKSCR